MQGTGGFGRCNIATGSVPLPPFLLLLAPIRTAQRQFLFLINPLRRFSLALLDPALPCSRRRSLPLLAIVLFSAPNDHHLPYLSGHHHHHPASTTLHIPTTALSPSPLHLPSQRQPAHAVCCVAVLAGLSASRSPTWAIRRPQSQQQGQHRCGPRSPFFLFRAAP